MGPGLPWVGSREGPGRGERAAVWRVSDRGGLAFAVETRTGSWLRITLDQSLRLCESRLSPLSDGR